MDLVCATAVIQHVTDQVFDLILAASYRILKPGGRIAFDVVVENDDWMSE